MPWSRLAGMGFEFGASLAVFMLLGWWVDYHWHIARHWGLLIGTLAGLAGGSYNFIRETIQAIRLVNRQKPGPKGESSARNEKNPPPGSDDSGKNGVD
jgi:F0F1-type ATP synthase assembly protein I